MLDPASDLDGVRYFFRTEVGFGRVPRLWSPANGNKVWTQSRTYSGAFCTHSRDTLL